MAHSKHRWGYALPIVLCILLLLGMAFSLVVSFLASSVTESRRVAGNMRAFYACDSAIRLASQVAQPVVLANSRAQPDRVTKLALDAICAASSGCVGTRKDVVRKDDSGNIIGTECTKCEYRAEAAGDAAGPNRFMPDATNMEIFKLRAFPAVSTKPIQFGAFRDMNAQQSLVAIAVQAVDRSTGTIASARESFSVASVSPFQFMAFSTAALRWSPEVVRYPPDSLPSIPRLGPSAYAGGPLVLNNLSLLRVTRAVSATSLSGTASVWTGLRIPNPAAPAVATDFATINSVMSGASIGRGFVISEPLKLVSYPLKMPGQPSGERATSAHWLIEPPGPDDGAAAADAKLAMQADIRIIDGVWFIKPLPNDTDHPRWPGIPIWSDRAGKDVFPATAEESQLMSPSRQEIIDLPKIGQEDIMVDRGLPPTYRPRLYSYYESNSSGQLIETPRGTGPREGRGIVSYGILSTVSGTATLIPGYVGAGDERQFSGSFVIHDDDLDDRVCWNALQTGNPTPGSTSAFGTFNPFDHGCRSQTHEASRYLGAGLLDGARTGFRDRSTTAAEMRVMPMNFDVEQFLQAMLSDEAGELGTYFCAGDRVDDVAPPEPLPQPNRCRPFNGIVYVAATWSGSLDGLYNTSAPKVAPPQADATSMASSDLRPRPTWHRRNYWLPRQLCGSPALQGEPLEGATPASLPARNLPPVKLFPIVGCGTPEYNSIYGPGGPQAGVNALRLVNARDLTPLMRPRLTKRRLGNHQDSSTPGLTIVSNLPVYMYGDLNGVFGPLRNPDLATCVPPGPPAPGCGFPLAMVAGDRTSFLSRVGNCGDTPGSSGYNDFCTKLRWDDPKGGLAIARPTQFIGTFMSGLATNAGAADNTEDFESLFRVTEHWPMSGSPTRPSLDITGAMFATGRAIYQKPKQTFAPFPRIDWRYQSALGNLDQPNGAPRFVVGVTSRWRDLR